MTPQGEHPLELLVRNLELHAVVGPESRAALLGLSFRLKEFEATSYLVREGDRPTHCGVPLTGFAYRQKQTGGGQRQIVSVHIPGEALDFQHLFLDVADHSIQMLTRGEVALIPLKEIQQLMQDDAAVARAILTSILVEASIFREWVLNIGRRDARSRMAHLLCEFAIRMQASGLADEDGYKLPITQEQFADAVGLTPVHVNRTLKALEAEGVVTRNKRTIGIPSWKRLRDIADFNQRYLHLTGPTAQAA